jgi:hypothetical protein
MIRWYPMVRAKSQVGGHPIEYDMKELQSLTRCLVTYPALVRDLETVRRQLRRKRFGTRPVVELQFEAKHTADLNTTARYQVVGTNQLPAANDFSSPAWTAQDATLTPNVGRGPLGATDADLIADASVPNTGLLFARVMSTGSLFAHQSKTALFSVFVRADVPHPARIDIRANASPDLQVTKDFQAEKVWRRQVVRNTFNTSLTTDRSSWAFITPAPNGTGEMHVAYPDMREIFAMPGTDEEILSDLYGKVLSDDWLIELSLDGGLTWREVLAQEHEISLVEDKAIGLGIRFLFECATPIFTQPPILDGTW